MYPGGDSSVGTFTMSTSVLSPGPEHLLLCPPLDEARPATCFTFTDKLTLCRVGYGSLDLASLLSKLVTSILQNVLGSSKAATTSVLPD